MAAIAAAVALIPAAGSTIWAASQSRSAAKSARLADGQLVEAKKQVAAAEVQARLANDAVRTARDQLATAERSLKIAADQLGSSRGVALGQLLLMLDQLMAGYVDVHVRVHPRSRDTAWTVSKPPSPDEQIRIETYMGLFERLFVLIEREIIPADIARRFYRYRVGNLADNEWVRTKKLREQSAGWADFLALCDEFDIRVTP